jgi:hypothetical protein
MDWLESSLNADGKRSLRFFHVFYDVYKQRVLQDVA